MITRFMLKCLATLILEDKGSVDVTPDAYWRFNAEQDRADALKIYNFDKGVRSYYTVGEGPLRRSATNSALDVRLLWHWLRDPARDPACTERPNIDDLLAPISSELAASSRAVEPYFGRDLVVA